MKKVLFRKALLLPAVVLLSCSAGNFLSAQQHSFCGTDEIMADLLKHNPDVVRAQRELEAFTREYVLTHTPEVSERGAPQYVIPVVFHVIHDRGPENVSDAVVDSAISVLNRDYQKLNPDTTAVQAEFKHLIADCNIEFRLAQIDPEGNCTNGIDRIYSYRTYQGNDLSKLGIWDRKNYLNIWLVNQMSTPGVLAYAYLPAGAAGLGYKVDGVIAWYQYVGTGQRTLTHEIGHVFNLEHTWGGGQVGTACGDDGVEDTPVTEGFQGPPCPTNKVDYSCDSSPIDKTYQFDYVTTMSGDTEPNSPIVIINPTTPDTGLTLMNFKAVGLSANSTMDSAFAFSGWDTGGVDGANGDTTFNLHTGSIDTSKYYEFSVRPVFGQGMSITGIRFFARRDSTGPRMFSIRSSASAPSYSSNLTSSVAPANANLAVFTDTIVNPHVPYIFYFRNDVDTLVKGCRVTINTGPFLNTDKTITFRIYAWNAEDAAGIFQIDSVAVLGTFGTIENLDNYMDYAFCMHMFTIGQAERMHAALESPISSRNNLSTPENHALTGIDNPQTCPPQADFYVKKTMACQNTGQVQFFDYSSRGTVITRNWSFPNGTPSTSTVQNPIVTFNTLWGQSATLTVSNSAGSTSITKDNMVWVAPPWADYSGLYYEDFEDPSHFNSMWQVDNRYNTASVWRVTNTGTFPSGNHGLKLNAFSPMVLSNNTTPQIIIDPGIGAYDKDAFVTPAFDLSHINSGTGKLEFKYSCATRASNAGDLTETLTIQYSTTCGNTWANFSANAGTISGATLANVGSWQEDYTPSVPTQWTLKSITLPQQALVPNVRFKFEYTSSYSSNNIYIDDVNISGTVGIEDNNPGISADLNVFPNPAAGDVSVSYRLTASRNVKLQVFDAIGNLVYDLINEKQAAGSYTVNFSTSKIANGIYHVNLAGDNVILRTEKIAVIK